jgi:S-adenosyl-L-methionine hydrolase (adenosine-forming)
MGAVITLTTDFGLSDGYVAAIKGVILSINPEVTIVDICHNIQPQDIRQAAFVLSTAYGYFPSQTNHLVVVDPGVGTNRRPIILTTPRACFVGPDNGVLSYIIRDYSSQPLPDSQRVSPGPDLKAYVITKSEYWRKPVSNTFHGRDIFAPIAARLSLGMPAYSLGERVDTITTFAIPQPTSQENGIGGQILHSDNFGNLITNIKKDILPESVNSIKIIVSNHQIQGIVNNYSEGQDLMALIGSSGYLEISRKNGNASGFLNAQIGDEVRVEF